MSVSIPLVCLSQVLSFFLIACSHKIYTSPVSRLLSVCFCIYLPYNCLCLSPSPSLLASPSLYPIISPNANRGVDKGE